jgi:hypothetical protein
LPPDRKQYCIGTGSRQSSSQLNRQTAITANSAEIMSPVVATSGEQAIAAKETPATGGDRTEFPVETVSRSFATGGALR